MMLAFGCLCGIACAQSGDEVNRAQESYWSVGLATGFGQDVLGSEDVRRGGIYSVQYSMPWNRLRFRNTEGQLVLGGYYMFTKGAGYEGIPVDHLHTYGFSAAARYWNHVFKGTETFFDFGWGFAFSNREKIGRAHV